MTGLAGDRFFHTFQFQVAVELHIVERRAWLSNSFCHVQHALSFAMGPYLLGFKGPAQCIEFEQKPMKVHVVPRSGGKPQVYPIAISKSHPALFSLANRKRMASFDRCLFMGPAQCIESEQKPMKVHVVPRSGAKPQVYPIAMSDFHPALFSLADTKEWLRLTGAGSQGTRAAHQG